MRSAFSQTWALCALPARGSRCVHRAERTLLHERLGRAAVAAAELAEALGARRSGDGWLARCVAHEDRDPSLSVAEGDDGRPLVHCHAGCSQFDVLAALTARCGQLSEWSFNFTSTREKRETDSSGRVIRVVIEADLNEVSPVPRGAYGQPVICRGSESVADLRRQLEAVA